MTDADLNILKAEFGTVPVFVAKFDTLDEGREILRLRAKALSPRYRAEPLKKPRKGGLNVAIIDDHHPRRRPGRRRLLDRDSQRGARLGRRREREARSPRVRPAEGVKQITPTPTIPKEIKRAAARILDGSPSGTTVALFETLGIPEIVLKSLEAEGACWHRTVEVRPVGKVRTYYPGRKQ